MFNQLRYAGPGARVFIGIAIIWIVYVFGYTLLFSGLSEEAFIRNAIRASKVLIALPLFAFVIFRVTRWVLLGSPRPLIPEAPRRQPKDRRALWGAVALVGFGILVAVYEGVQKANAPLERYSWEYPVVAAPSNDTKDRLRSLAVQYGVSPDEIVLKDGFRDQRISAADVALAQQRADDAAKAKAELKQLIETSQKLNATPAPPEAGEKMPVR